ncbi:hypothetical protein OSB04_008239 [Centaurea solstitialis]|uniref:Uncharacterized protein n=1 Tax=Centaurea solstitialis TaxID=347529 RepID=A0AA38TN45_9ASTR|nr:hypothetical protein OSB04_008239 [Centaurea solstitialis]
MAIPLPTSQWVCIAFLALLGSTLTLAHVVKPITADSANMVKPHKTHLDHAVKPPKADRLMRSSLRRPTWLNRLMWPTDSRGQASEGRPAQPDHKVKPKADPAHAVKPPKADLAQPDHKVKPQADPAHAVKPPKADLAQPDHKVKPKADPAHAVKPPKADLAQPDHKADLAHAVKPPKVDPAHAVKPPKATISRKLQMEKMGESEATDFWASDSVPSGCDGRGQAQVTNPGYASGSECSFGSHNTFPFHTFPFGSGMPQVSTWGEGGGYGYGYGGSNTNAGVSSRPSGN